MNRRVCVLAALVVIISLLIGATSGRTFARPLLQSSGPSPTPDWMAFGNQIWAEFGFSVDTAGDVNGDGYADVIIGARNYENGQTSEGRAYVYYGSPAGLNSTPAWIAEGDQADAWFGICVGTAGDVNGDGYDDIIVGASQYSSPEQFEGRAYVYYGSVTGLSTTADWVTEGDQVDAFFGNAVGTAGDVNGDGYDDVIVGAASRGSWEGDVFVYYGSAAGLSTTPDWTQESATDAFGIAVATAGDVNGDGFADVVIEGADFMGEAGIFFVYHGSAAGLSEAADWSTFLSGAGFPNAAATAGDVNGDGYDDVIVGAPLFDGDQEDEGCVNVYYGSPSGLSINADWTVEGDLGYAQFGSAVATAGDVNGDGYTDVAVGARNHEPGGRAYVFAGSATGLIVPPALIIESDQTYTDLGKSVGTAGDVNGDGADDIIVGAPRYSNIEYAEGAAFVYHGLSEIGPMSVDIDIKPGSDLNSIYCHNENGVISVAILTTDDFDATTVDHSKVTFEGASETHVDKNSGEPRRHERDVDGDGDKDLVFHFRLGDTALTCDATEATLIGETFDGQAIEGTDVVRMVEVGRN